MLNTTSLRKKNALSQPNIIDLVGGELINVHNIDSQNEIIKSFHSIGGHIFNNTPTAKTDVNINNTNFTNNINANANTSVNNMDINDANLMITFDKTDSKIIVSSDYKTIGYFTVYHLVKYLGEIYDRKNQFLSHILTENYNNGKKLIKHLIVTLQYNKDTGYTSINLHDYEQSGFMADIELLIKLNNLLNIYQTNELNNDLQAVDAKYRHKIEQNIKKFIYVLLNYTLKLISIKSDELKANNEKRELKDKLMGYSISVVYKITLFVQEHLNFIENQNEQIKKSIELNIELKKDLDKKIIQFSEHKKKHSSGCKEDTPTRNKANSNHTLEMNGTMSDILKMFDLDSDNKD